MDYHNFKSVLNRIYAHYIGGDSRPVYFDIEKSYPELNYLTKNYNVIKNEFEQLYQRQVKMPKYHEIDPGESKISNTTEKNWNVFLLYLLGKNPEDNLKLCPETCRLLKSVPNVIQAFFSILEPGKKVPLHEGPYLGYLRYHLGIQVPTVNPPSIMVNSQEYVWKNGEGVLFDDYWPHEVKNDCEEMRVVLIVDVLRPMPLLPTLINKISTNFIAKHTYGRKLVKRVQAYNENRVLKMD